MARNETQTPDDCGDGGMSRAIAIDRADNAIQQEVSPHGGEEAVGGRILRWQKGRTFKDTVFLEDAY